MRYSAALVAATSLFLTTSAFLVTPEIAEAASEAQDAWNSLIYGGARTLEVACKDCDFFVEEKTSEALNSAARLAIDGVENTIHLEFSAENNELRVNNATLYPLEMVNDHFPDVTVHQIRTDNGDAGIEVPVDFTVGVESKSPPKFHRGKFGRMRPEDNTELLSMDFTVLSLAGQPVKAQTAHLEVIRDQDGALTIVRVEAAEFNPSTEDPCTNARNPSVCRVKVMLAQRLRQMIEEAQARAAGMKSWMKTHAHASASGNKTHKKPCSGRGRHHASASASASASSGGKPDGDHSGRPHHGHHGHGPHGRHHHGHKVAHAIHHILRNFVVPAMLGIAGGLAASALGMMVGQMIAFLWFRFGRGGRRGQVENVRVYEVEVVEGEKDDLIAEDLPRYEEAPKYEDVEAQTQTLQ